MKRPEIAALVQFSILNRLNQNAQFLQDLRNRRGHLLKRLGQRADFAALPNVNFLAEISFSNRMSGAQKIRKRTNKQQAYADKKQHKQHPIEDERNHADSRHDLIQISLQKLSSEMRLNRSD